MQFWKYLGSVTAVALVLSLGAFAKDVKSGKFELAQAAKIGSTVLPPGQYKAQWTGSANAVKVSILQGRKTVATAEAEIKELPAKAQNNAVTFKQLDNNTDRVDEIDFNHSAEALVFPGM